MPVRMVNLALRKLGVPKNQLVTDIISIVDGGATRNPVLHCDDQAETKDWYPSEHFDLHHLQVQEKTSVLDLLAK